MNLNTLIKRLKQTLPLNMTRLFFRSLDEGILVQDSNGSNLLMYASYLDWDRQRDIAEDLIKYAMVCAMTHDQIAELLNMRTKSQDSVISIAVVNDCLGLLGYLRDQFQDELVDLVFPEREKISNEERINLLYTLDTLKSTWLDEKLDRASFDVTVLEYYINLLNSVIKPLPLTFAPANSDQASTLSMLFGEGRDYQPVEIAIADIQTAFYNPSRLLPYLQFLEREFNRYYIETHHQLFPTLSPHSYKYTMIDTYEFPIPNGRFKGINKSSALQEFLMSFLSKTAGWGAESFATEWLGFIPTKKANKSLGEDKGVFITEGRVNQGLFHGKLTHMLQLALISLLIQDNKLGPVTLHQIVSHLVSHKTVDNESLWGKVLDLGDLTKVYFGNPYFLHTMIMRHGHTTLQTPSLADHMIDTFCKGFNKLVRTQYPKAGVTGKIKFLQEMNYQPLRIFNIPTELLQKYVRMKLKYVREMDGEQYAILRKPYHPNHAFTPNRYSLFSQPETAKQGIKRAGEPMTQTTEHKRPRLGSRPF